MFLSDFNKIASCFEALFKFVWYRDTVLAVSVVSLQNTAHTIQAKNKPLLSTSRNSLWNAYEWLYANFVLYKGTFVAIRKLVNRNQKAAGLRV